MRMLIAFLAGWLFLEAAPSPDARWYAPGHPLGLWARWQSSLWIFAGLATWAAWSPVRGRGSWGWLVAFAGGLTASSLILPTPFFWFGPLGGWALLMGLAGAGLWFTGRPIPSSTAPDTDLPAAQSSAESEKADPEPLLHPAWWALAGFTVVLPLTALLRRLWRLGMSEATDFQITAWVLGFLFAAGAIAFGRLIPAHRLRFGAGIALACYGLTCLAGHRAAETLATNRGLRSLVRRFELDLSYVGTHVYGVLVGVSILIMPAFAIGALLYALQSRAQRFGLAIGAGLGVQATPWILDREWAWNTQMGPTSVLLLVGVALAGLSAACILSRGQRWLWAGGTLAVTVAACSMYPFGMLVQGKPWSRAVKEVLWAYDAPKGQLAIVSEGIEGFSVRFDQRQITPTMEWLRLDQRMLQASLATYRGRHGASPKVLFSGLLTPERAAILKGYGVERVDRVGPYWRFGMLTERRLFGGGHGHGSDHPAGGQADSGHDDSSHPNLPRGEWLAPNQAWQRVQDGRYDLIMVPPESFAFGDTPPGVWQVRWTRVDDGAAQQPGPEDDWLLVADGLQRFALGWVDGATEWEAPPGLWSLPPGEPRALASRLGWMGLREWERPERARQAFFARSAASATDAGRRTLWETLADLQAMQRHSSPWESEAERLEWDATIIERIASSLLALPADNFTVEMAGGLARILVGKREIAPLLEWLPQLSQHMGEPYELERSIARGELESLEPKAAAQRLSRLRSRFPEDAGLLRELAIAYDQSNRPSDSKGIWAQILAGDPGDSDAEKAWVMALLRSEDPRGKEALQSLKDRFPEDLGLQEVSQNGPYPVLEPSYRPLESRHDGHGHPE